MARGTNLTTLIQMVRSEAGHSVSVAAGVDFEPTIIQKIQRTQQLLYDAYDWSFMRSDWPTTLQAGDRYYDMPQEAGFPGGIVLNSERIEAAWIDYSGRPIPIARGIGQPEYAQYNSANGDRASPARKWDIVRSTDGAEQIEIWPIPADNTEIFWLRGYKKLRPLIAPGDVADLDDYLIVLHVAAEMLAKQKSTDAKKIEQAASFRLSQLKGRTKTATPMITLTGKGAGGNANAGKTIIRIGSSTN